MQILTCYILSQTKCAENTKFMHLCNNNSSGNFPDSLWNHFFESILVWECVDVWSLHCENSWKSCLHSNCMRENVFSLHWRCENAKFTVRGFFTFSILRCCASRHVSRAGWVKGCGCGRPSLNYRLPMQTNWFGKDKDKVNQFWKFSVHISIIGSVDGRRRTGEVLPVIASCTSALSQTADNGNPHHGF